MKAIQLVASMLAREIATLLAVKWASRDNEMVQMYELQAQLLSMYEDELRHDQDVTVVVELEE